MQAKNLFKVIDISRFKTVNFVETGSYLGDGVKNALLNGISNVFTCDIMPEFIEKVKLRFPEHKDNFYTGTSTYFLKVLLPKLKGSTLFFLDAHFPHYYYETHRNIVRREKVDIEIPLFNECKIIANRKNGVENDIIIIDDVDCIDDYIGTPKPEEHKIGTHFTSKKFTTKDLINLFPNHDFIAPFKESDECMYMFFPKKYNCNFGKMGLTKDWYTKDEDWDTKDE